MPVKTWGLRLLGTLAFLGLLLLLDLRGDLPIEQLWSALVGADPVLTAFSIGLYVPFLAVKAARWRAISTGMGMVLSWSQAWRIYAIGLAAGTFTPGQAGDTVKSLFLGRMGYSLSRALGGSLLDRLFDVAGLALLGLLGVLVFGGRFAGQTPVLVGWAALCVLVLVLITWNRSRNWAHSYIGRASGKLRPGRNDASSTAGDAGLGWSLHARTIVGAALLTVGSFALSIFRVWLLAGAVGVWLGPFEVAGFVGLTTAAALVPVSVGGVGTRDVVASLALAQLGYGAVQGVAISTLILLLNSTQAVAGWLVWQQSGRLGTRLQEKRAPDG